MSDTTDHPLFAAVYDPVTALAEATTFAPHRRYVTNGLEGRVLDLGAGTGAMVPYFVAARDEARGRGGDLDVHLLDPDASMRERAAKRARDAGLDATVVAGRGESLLYPDDSFDAVVSALVGCTIPDLDAALDEVARVLRPGGEFRFFEHVAADGALGRLQSLVDPVWTRLAAGCHLDRDLETVYREHPRFELRTVEYASGIPPTAPFVRGVAAAIE